MLVDVSKIVSDFFVLESSTSKSQVYLVTFLWQVAKPLSSWDIYFSDQAAILSLLVNKDVLKEMKTEPILNTTLTEWRQAPQTTKWQWQWQWPWNQGWPLKRLQEDGNGGGGGGGDDNDDNDDDDNMIKVYL